MSRVIMFSRVFPTYHVRKGQPTDFVEKFHWSIWANPEVETRKYAPDLIRELNPNIPEDELQNFIDSLDDDDCFNEQQKHHTIRAGHRWKVGDWFSPRVWSGKPYASKRITIAPDIQIKKVFEFDITVEDDYKMIAIDRWPFYEENEEMYTQAEALETLAKNDGLTVEDFKSWFKWPKEFSGQVICWSDKIDY